MFLTEQADLEGVMKGSLKCRFPPEARGTDSKGTNYCALDGPGTNLFVKAVIVRESMEVNYINLLAKNTIYELKLLLKVVVVIYPKHSPPLEPSLRIELICQFLPPRRPGNGPL